MDKSNIKKFLKGGLYGAVDESISMVPGLNIAWGFFKEGKAALSSSTYIKTTEFLKFLELNKEIFFSKNLFENDNFITGFALTFENYLKQRSSIKRRYIQEIFKGFALDNDKENFELERMYNAINLISIDSIKYLAFLRSTILDEQLASTENSFYNGSDLGKVRLESEHPISRFISNYYEMNVSLGSNTMPENIQELFNLKSDIDSELITLGIFRTINDPKSHRSGGFGVSSLVIEQELAFTIFGKQFIQFINNESLK